MPAPFMNEPIKGNLDRQAKRFSATMKGVTRTAAFYGDQGCVIHPEGRDRVYFTPVPVRSLLPDAAKTPWPMGDAPSGKPYPKHLDRAKVAAAVDMVFADPEGLSAAMLVLYKGEIVGERYMERLSKDTQLENWSMGKSLMATLTGVAIQQGAFKLDDPAPVPAWRKPGDPRGGILVRDILRMSSGLGFSGMDDPHDAKTQFSDHLFIYAGAVDSAAYVTSSPLEFAPNTWGRYRNCDPLTLVFLARQYVEKNGEEWLTWPQRALFDKIGIRRQVLEPDPYGNFLISGFDYGTARNWARIGLLHLQDGVWNGKRILPEGWAKFVSTPAPAWSTAAYGGLWWLNVDGSNSNLPRDAYRASGGGDRLRSLSRHSILSS